MAAYSLSVYAGLSSTNRKVGRETAGFLMMSNVKLGRRSGALTLEALRLRATNQEQESLVFGGADEDDVKEKEKEQLRECWKKIHGKHDWAGLLDPMSPILRAELIRYGEMAQVCYSAFNNDPNSITWGECKYREEELLASTGYTVTRYLYATSTINILPAFFKKPVFDKAVGTLSKHNANWIGYVAVSDEQTSALLGRRDILVAWRGTVTGVEWLHDLLDILRPISSRNVPCSDPEVKVESGFVRLYTARQKGCKYTGQSPRDQVLEEVKKLVSEYGDEVDKGLKGASITVTGHSLGSALAVLSAFDVAETGIHLSPMSRPLPVSVFSFSGPRVGNRRFKERLETLAVKVLRVYNVRDVVPAAPGLFINEHWPRLLRFVEGLFPWCYSHVGSHLALDHRRSTFLKSVIPRAAAHDLELLLHLIDGWHGTGEPFTLATERDITLLNADIVRES